jgi:hypothetical protein
MFSPKHTPVLMCTSKDQWPPKSIMYTWPASQQMPLIAFFSHPLKGPCLVLVIEWQS